MSLYATLYYIIMTQDIPCYRDFTVRFGLLKAVTTKISVSWYGMVEVYLHVTYTSIFWADRIMKVAACLVYLNYEVALACKFPF
jgi:hypothetical protein